MIPGRLYTNVALTPFNTFGVVAHTRYWMEVDEVAALSAGLQDARLQGLPRLVLGGGSNVLFTQDFPGVVFHMAIRGRSWWPDTNTSVIVRAGAGEHWHDFVQWTITQSWNGLERLSLIPGTVGAAPIQNIGAYGAEVQDCLHAIEMMDLDTGTCVQVTAAQCALGYRDSAFKHAWRDRFVITHVEFQLSTQWVEKPLYPALAAHVGAAQVASARELADAVIAVRRSKLPDPERLGNAGSFFKNPIVDAACAEKLAQQYPTLPQYPAPNSQCKLAAAWLIEATGWKGRQWGQAGVSDQQALVLVNHGGAHGGEILALAEAIQGAVRERFGVSLEIEPLIL